MKGFLERSLSVWHKATKLRPNIEEVMHHTWIREAATKFFYPKSYFFLNDKPFTPPPPPPLSTIIKVYSNRPILVNTKWKENMDNIFFERRWKSKHYFLCVFLQVQVSIDKVRNTLLVATTNCFRAQDTSSIIEVNLVI